MAAPAPPRRRRLVPRPVPPAPGLAHLPPLLARIYAARGVREAAELDTGLSALPPPAGLPDVDEAAERLAADLSAGRRIVVVGDYDADGATSTALLIDALRALGAEAPSFLIPDRFRDGYGLGPALAEQAAALGAHTVVTVDNGTAAFAGVERARALGLQVLVTDHHLPGPELPPADALVNPVLEGAAFPGRCLAGVGVAFYLLLALRARLRNASDGSLAARARALNAGDLLDLVALGTVADVVPLDQVNRILVDQGLRRLRAGRVRPGIAALLELAGRPPERLVARDLAFGVAPRLNAAGRLDDMTVGVRCLLSADVAGARALAARLDAFNRSRRTIEAEMQRGAWAALDEASVAVGDNARRALVLHDPRWHEGVVGLLAGRIRERCHRPVVAFAPAAGGSGEATLLKGSGRSVPELHLRDALALVDARAPGLIERFGGHAMAAGLTLRAGHLDAFTAAFEAVVRERLPAAALAPELETDGTLSGAELSLANAERLAAAGPFGQGFPPPLFQGDFAVADARRVGAEGAHLRLALQHPEVPRPLPAIAFRTEGQPWRDGARCVRAAYRPEVNLWRGERTLQLVVDYLEALD